MNTFILLGLLSKYYIQKSGGGGDILVVDYWGCTAGWGRIFTTGLTIRGHLFRHFQLSYLNGVALFGDFSQK